MPAVSKAQQRFFGMVRSAQKGKMKNPSSEVLDVADDISVKDAKKFAKTKHKGLPEKKKMKENVTLQDANGNDFIEIIDLIKPEPLVKKEEDDYSTRDRELKRTKKGRDQRYKTLHKGTNDQNMCEFHIKLIPKRNPFLSKIQACISFGWRCFL